MNKRNNAEKNKLKLMVGAVLLAYTSVVVLFCIFSRQFSEIYCRTVSAFLRKVISSVTGVLPFSIAEILLFLIPLIWIVSELILAFRKRFKYKSFALRIFVFVCVLVFLFVNVFGVCYTRWSLEKNMEFGIVDFSDTELKASAEFVRNRLVKSCDGITFLQNGASENPHDWKTLNKKIDSGFERLRKEYNFLSDVKADAKKIALSRYMTYTHISGIFMPFTAEANVNINYPDYVVAFSTAHEKAHQRGVAGEDEANFVAFLACLASEDEYLEYAALLSMYDYYLDEAYISDREMYYDLLNGTDKRILREMYAYSVFFDEYRNSTASVVADKVNDTYIKTMGDSGGVKSYGRVVKLATSYLIQKRALPY